MYLGYLRLSLIACEKGKVMTLAHVNITISEHEWFVNEQFDDGTAWLSRALEINSEEPDVNICLGDLYYRNSLAEDARKCYEKMSTKVVHQLLTCFASTVVSKITCASLLRLLRCQDKRESRAMLSLGNFYFARALLAKAGSDATGAAQFLKDSYKFFHHVLVQDVTNAYGMLHSLGWYPWCNSSDYFHQLRTDWVWSALRSWKSIPQKKYLQR